MGAVFWIAVGTVATAIVRACAENGPDFTVYHTVTARLLGGGPLYSAEHDAVMMFKYPPWWAPVFFPFSGLGHSKAHLVWGLLMAGAFLWLVRWLLRQGISKGNLVLALVLSYGAWNTLAFTGQISVFLCAGALALYGSRKTFEAQTWQGDLRRAGLVWLLSAKILTLLPLAFVWKSYRRRQTWAFLLALLGSLTLWTAALDPSGLGVLPAWLDAIRTRPHPTLGPTISVAMREAQSLVSIVWRQWHLDVMDHARVQMAVVIVAIATTAFALRISRHWPDLIRFSLALAVMTTVQPLALFYAYPVAFPLMLFAIQSSQTTSVRISAWAALMLTYAVTEKTLGSVGSWLEFYSVKMWGVYLAIWVLAQRFRKRNA